MQKPPNCTNRCPPRVAATHAKDVAWENAVLGMDIPIKSEDVRHTAIRAILAEMAAERACFGFVRPQKCDEFTARLVALVSSGAQGAHNPHVLPASVAR